MPNFTDNVCLPESVSTRPAALTAVSRVDSIGSLVTNPVRGSRGRGNITLSITWITPFDAFWFGITTGLPDAVITCIIV